MQVRLSTSTGLSPSFCPLSCSLELCTLSRSQRATGLDEGVCRAVSCLLPLVDAKQGPVSARKQMKPAGTIKNLINALYTLISYNINTSAIARCAWLYTRCLSLQMCLVTEDECIRHLERSDRTCGCVERARYDRTVNHGISVTCRAQSSCVLVCQPRCHVCIGTRTHQIRDRYPE